MGYFKEDGGYADTDECFLASGVLAATQNGTSIPAGDRATVRLALDVTAITGSPTLDVTIETSEDQLVWTTVAVFAQASGVIRLRKVFSGLDKYVRARETLGGTGTVTRTIKGAFV
jgi:hypothetical protein